MNSSVPNHVDPSRSSSTSPPKSFIDRFWSKIEKTDSCWLWTAAKTRGYGQIGSGGRLMRAHRVAWALHFGPIPDGLWVLHRCDTGACVNPSHLWLGTHADNMRDMAEKGRGGVARGERHGSRTHPERLLRGERNGRAKLDEHKVRAVRVLAADGYRQADLARHFGVTISTISDCVRRRTWKHVGAAA